MRFVDSGTPHTHASAMKSCAFIAHFTRSRAEISCTSIRMRVKIALKLNSMLIVCVVPAESCDEASSDCAECSGLPVSLESEGTGRYARRSITELKSDSHSPSSTGISHSPVRGKTSPSCGVFPTLKISPRRLRRAARLAAAPQRGSALIAWAESARGGACARSDCSLRSSLRSALGGPAVLSGVHASSQANSYQVPESDFDPESLCALPPAWRRAHNTAAARVMRIACGAPRSRLLTPRATEFISVGSFGPDRSALCSDMRFACISGVAAATVPLSAPMNSSTVTQIARRAGFLFNSSI